MIRWSVSGMLALSYAVLADKQFIRPYHGDDFASRKSQLISYTERVFGNWPIEPKLSNTLQQYELYQNESITLIAKIHVYLYLYQTHSLAFIIFINA